MNILVSPPSGLYYPNFCGFVEASMLDLCTDFVEWQDKITMEQDENYKQLIPYIVVYCRESEEFFAYIRTKKSGEQRLHTKCSLGVGGHVEEELDAPESTRLPPACAIDKCAQRELKEELGFTIPTIGLRHPQVVGYVNEDITPVGRVHFGIVYLQQVTHNESNSLSFGDEIGEPQWMNKRQLAALEYGKFELWSQFVLGAILSNKLIPGIT